MKKKLIFVLLSLLTSSALWAADGDSFTANTVEGVEMTFTVISESEKTCQVYKSSWNSAISSSITGTVTIPSEINGYQVTGIGHSAFNYCSLSTVVIPECVVSIGEYAFADCYDLSSVNIPNGVTTIEDGTFCNCQSLTTIIIPNTVTSIKWYAFEGCGLTSIHIPSSVTEISSSAFSGCIDLETIVVSTENTVYDSRDNCNAIIKTSNNTLIGGCKNSIIPNTITCIGEWAFNYCTDLSSVTIPSSVTTISDCAFQGCSGLTDISMGEGLLSIGDGAFGSCEELTNVIIPEGVTNIGDNVFSNCYSLSSVTIPSSVTTIGSNPFYGCSYLTSVISHMENPPTFNSGGALCNYSLTLYVPEGTVSTYYSMRWGDYFGNIKELDEIIAFEDDLVKEICVANFDSNNDGELSAGEAKNVSYIGQYTFQNKDIQSFKELKYFTGVTQLIDNTFSGCSNLSSIIIPKGITQIGNGVFVGCDELSIVIVDAKNSVFDSRDNCNAIIETNSNILVAGCKNTIIPEGVVALGDYAFYNNRGLTSISIPSSLTTIGEETFSSCYNLESINVEEGNSVFDSRDNCNAIIETSSNKLILGCKSTIIPDDVTSIEENAFLNINEDNITIPASVTEIGSCAFDGSCQYVFSKITEPFDTQGFYTMDTSSSTLYVPQGTKNAYMNCDGWGDFGKIIEVAPVQVTLAKNTITFASEQLLDFSTPIDGLKAYVISGVNYEGKAMLSEVNTAVSAGEGLILRGTAGTTYEIPSTMDVPNKISNLLIGVTEDTQIGLGGGFFWDPYYEEWILGSCSDYILSDGKFVKASEGTLKAGKAFLRLPYYFNSRELILFDADATGIREAKNANNNSSDNYYNLNGQRVSTPQKGLYIVNGKKVIKK